MPRMPPPPRPRNRRRGGRRCKSCACAPGTSQTGHRARRARPIARADHPTQDLARARPGVQPRSSAAKSRRQPRLSARSSAAMTTVSPSATASSRSWRRPPSHPRRGRVLLSRHDELRSRRRPGRLRSPRHAFRGMSCCGRCAHQGVPTTLPRRPSRRRRHYHHRHRHRHRHRTHSHPKRERQLPMRLPRPPPMTAPHLHPLRTITTRLRAWRRCWQGLRR